MRTKGLITVLVLACVHVCQSPAWAADCGTTDPEGGGTLKGTLTLDDRASTIRRDFRREQGERAFQIVFDVANCEVVSQPNVAAGPLKDVEEEIPDAALGRPRGRSSG